MKTRRRCFALLTAVTVFSACATNAQAQTVTCTGFPAWGATTTYAAGAQVTYQGGLYSAIISTTNVPPSYCPACGWWRLVGTCDNSATCPAAPSAPTGLASPSQTTSSVNLTWNTATAGSGCTVSYKVFQNGVQVVTPSTNAASISGLTAGTTYSFTVAAVDSAGTSAQSAALSVKTSSTATCSAVAAVPSGLTASNVTDSAVNLSWNTVATPTNCAVSYNVYRDGSLVTTATTAASAVISGLTANTTYGFTVASMDAAGTSAQSSKLSVQTLPGSSNSVTTTGTINFHLLLGVSSAGDKLVLAGDGYTDLIMSNFVAGVMEGRLIQEFYPGIQFNKDYLYGSIMGQLLQENIATELYQSGQDLIAPSADQQAVMGSGQGGPYQINNYAVDMVAGTYTPGGYSLINFVALQKNIGYTMATASTQYTKATPASFNDKYYSPMLTAFFHYIDFVAMNVTGKGTGGWTTPWEPAYDNALANFKTLPNGFLDVILNVGYNQGFYGGLVASYSGLGATATASTVASIRSYGSVWGKTSTYEQYPYQVMYYLDQMYGNPVPTTSPTTLVTPGNHIAFSVPNLGTVFSRVFQKLAYVNGSGQYVSISSTQAGAAFSSALSTAGVASTATLDLATASDRARIFTVLETAIGNLETSLGMKFSNTTNSQL